MKNPVKLFSTNQSFEIEVLKAKLEKNNIESYIMDKQDSAYVIIGELTLYVESTDLAKAQDLLSTEL